MIAMSTKESMKKTRVVRSERLMFRVLREVKRAYMNLTVEERKLVREILEKTILQMTENKPVRPREIKVDVRITAE